MSSHHDDLSRRSILLCKCLVAVMSFFASSANAQQTVDSWPPFEYHSERLAATPDQAIRPLAPEGPTESSSVLLNPADSSEPLPAPLPAPSSTITPEVQNESFWYPDYFPMWMIDPAWDAGLELGINATEGNAQALSVRAGGNVS